MWSLAACGDRVPTDKKGHNHVIWLWVNLMCYFHRWLRLTQAALMKNFQYSKKQKTYNPLKLYRYAVYLLSSHSWRRSPAPAGPASPAQSRRPSLLWGSRLGGVRLRPGGPAPARAWRQDIRHKDNWREWTDNSAPLTYIVIILQHALQNLFQVADLKGK